jgi:phosphocarrier protein
MSSSVEQIRTVQVRNKYGLHARPAAEFVKLANQFKSDIMVTKQDTTVNGKSIMGMMMLAAECGSDIVIRAAGSDAEQALRELVGLVEHKFNEE